MIVELQGEEAVLVSMKKAIDICVYYTLGREAKVAFCIGTVAVRHMRSIDLVA